MALAAAYLMVFNPRTEAVSYIILAPYSALFAALFFREKAVVPVCWLLVFICIGLGFGFLRRYLQLDPNLVQTAVGLGVFRRLGLWAFRKPSPFAWQKQG
jgi:hypothetical protein